MKNELDLARALMSKAESDRRMAEIGIEHDGPLDAVAFHVQQTAEKLLKALLASRSIECPRG
ncbi:MAG: HEPN domain-containing protein [Acidobacteriota bacterium]